MASFQAVRARRIRARSHVTHAWRPGWAGTGAATEPAVRTLSPLLRSALPPCALGRHVGRECGGRGERGLGRAQRAARREDSVTRNCHCFCKSWLAQGRGNDYDTYKNTAKSIFVDRDRLFASLAGLKLTFGSHGARAAPVRTDRQPTARRRAPHQDPRIC